MTVQRLSRFTPRGGSISLLVAFLCLLSAMAAAAGQTSSAPAPSVPSPIDQALTDLASEDDAVKEKAVRVLLEQGSEALVPRLEDIRSTADRSLRQALKPVLDGLKYKTKLSSNDLEDRRSAATDLGMLGRPEAMVWLERAATNESHRWVRYTMEESAALLRLASGNPADKLGAAKKLGELQSQNGLPALNDLVQALRADPVLAEANKGLLPVATEAIDQIETWSHWSTAIETMFRGVSLSSILLIMSLGLAVVFGLMGVINMAHGELMMVGAYTTFVTQEVFKGYVSAELFDHYFLLAMPLSFLVAGLCGFLLEATVIRFLYGRPLETMLATWGVSLVLIQAARVYFGDLTSVAAPSWLTGGVQVMVGVYLPYNRIFIIALSTLCVVGIYLLLFRSNVGLRVRAVTQNRNMSACLGIPTRRVDAYTFAFGSGLAGVAGWALTLIGNVEPGLGQNYIVDSFMVVVTGGVGKLAGTIVASLGIGGLNKLLEPSFGAVYGKVLILVLVILFLQRRPSGLFAAKGRHVES